MTPTLRAAFAALLPGWTCSLQSIHVESLCFDPFSMANSVVVFLICQWGKHCFHHTCFIFFPEKFILPFFRICCMHDYSLIPPISLFFSSLLCPLPLITALFPRAPLPAFPYCLIVIWPKWLGAKENKNIGMQAEYRSKLTEHSRLPSSFEGKDEKSIISSTSLICLSMLPAYLLYRIIWEETGQEA